MNYAAFLAVLVVMSFSLPLIIRLLPMLNPNVFMLLSLLLLVAVFVQLWQKYKTKQNIKAIAKEEKPEFSSPLLKPLNPEEDYHASL